MTIGQLSVTPRSGRGKGSARKLRAQGLVPGVVYGQKQDAVTVALDPRALDTLIRKSPWRLNTVIDLSVGESGSRKVLVKDINVHPVSRDILHVDFLNVDMDASLRADVPLKLVGRPEGVKAGGLLQQMVRTVRVECLPGAIPAAVEADISNLNRKDAMMLDQVPAPEGTRIVIRENIAIAVVS